MATSVKNPPVQTRKKDIEPGRYAFQLTNKIKPHFPGAAPYPRVYELPAMVQVFDEEANRTRMVRVVPGVNSIFVDDQNDSKVDNVRANSTAWVPQFNEGLLELNSPQDDQKIKRMLLDDRFDAKAVKVEVGKAPLFTLIKDGASAANNLKIAEQRKIATDRAWEAIEDMASIEAHAKFLGIKYKDGSRDKTEEEIKDEYIQKAQVDPALFNKSYKSPVVELKNLITKAVEKNIVDLGHVKGQAHWFETKGLITEKIDLSKDPIESLMAFATSDEGASFKERLKELV